MRGDRYPIYAALLAPWVGLIGILIAISLNPWWSLTDNAISDLGNIKRPWVSYPYVLNTALMLAGALIIYFLQWLILHLRDSLAKFGTFIFLLGSISLFLIGVFPEEAEIFGVEPHYYVSWGFFLLASFGMLIIGIAALRIKESRGFGAFSVLLFLLSWLLASFFLRTFKGVALAEFTGVFSLTLWLYVALLWKRGLRVLL